MNELIEKTVRNINISYLFAKSIEHGISYNQSNWELFEPTRFVYAFFTFNMLYDINWQGTFQRGYLWDSRAQKITSDKIILLLKYIYKYSQNKKFIDYYSKYDRSLTIVDNSKKIKIDTNITRIDETSFLNNKMSYVNNYKSVMRHLTSRNTTIEDHYKLIIFTYQIRNNIFHGLKKAPEMKESGQRKRLYDYSNLLLSSIEMFLDIMVERYNYELSKEDELIANAGISIHMD